MPRPATATIDIRAGLNKATRNSLNALVSTAIHVGHGTWVPGDSLDFDNHGTFVFWVEAPPSGSRLATRRKARPHPGHLSDSGELLGFLSSGLMFARAVIDRLNPEPTTLHASLPCNGTGTSPLPSIEMARLSGAFPPEDADGYEWRDSEIQGLSIARPLLFLKELRYAALSGRPGFHPGSDIRFWIRYARFFRNMVAGRQFLPVMKCHQPARKGAGLRIVSGWSPASGRYESTLEEFARSMPGVCRAVYGQKPEDPKKRKGSKGPKNRGTAPLECLSATDLLRHFSEQQLDRLVMDARVTASEIRRFNGNWPWPALAHPGHPDSMEAETAAGKPGIEDWKKWRAWQESVNVRPVSDSPGKTQDNTGFVLGVRLSQPDDPAEDGWRLDFLVSAAHDPSLQVLLKDWWELPKGRQAEWLKYFGGRFERNLLVSLGHAARMCPLLWEGMETSRPAGLEMDLETAYRFLGNDAPVLEAAGFRVLLPSWWTPRGRQRARIRINASGRPGNSGKSGPAQPSGYFGLDSVVQFRYELSVGGETVTPEEWRELVNAKSPLVRFRGEWMELDRDQMVRTLELWRQQEDGQGSHAISISGMLKEISEADGETTEFVFDEVLDDILARLERKRDIEPMDDPGGLRGELRPYQRQGLSWLSTMETLGLNPCLADDMGLGKTIQVIALLLHEREGAGTGRNPKLLPTLLIAPTSVLGNWQREIGKFAPQLDCVIHHGGDRVATAGELKRRCRENDILITSFTIARKDCTLLKRQQWRRIVVDEAQNIKNPQAAQTRAVCSLGAAHRLALTGTPVENRLMDLWSVFNFLNPGYLGNRSQFRKAYELPVQRDRNSARARQLQNLVHPFILRRMKTDREIISDLPEKVEQKVYCNLTREQASLYQATVDAVEEQIGAVDGMERRGLILTTLTRLKQICNHPAQFLQDGSPFGQNRSHKLARLSEMVEEALGESAGMLVFTQFTELGERLERFLRETHRCPVHYLHGGTSRQSRQRMIERFQDPETPAGIFILSLKAGGTGITLTRASHVFHFDRWWNPAVENQATDRAYRIGQKNPVFVHKMVTLGTLEERIDAMIEDKQALAESIVGADENWLTELDDGQFRQLISLNRQAILEAA